MLYRYLWLPIEAFSEREMGMMAFDQVMSLSLSYHTKRRTGELLRILGRSEAINDFFQILLFQMVPILIDLPVAFAVLWIRYGITVVAVVAVVSVI
jgi:ABC-type transport system involved in Fe-S cluster assembly fused permease/ATPase subunit